MLLWMFSFAIAAPLTLQEVEAHRDVAVHALRQGDFDGFRALYQPEALGLWAAYEYETWPAWHNEAARREACTYADLTQKDETHWTVSETCPGSQLTVSFHPGMGGWKRGKEHGEYRGTTVHETAWRETGPAVDGIDPPSLPFDAELSKPFVWLPGRMQRTKLAVVATLPDCSAVDSLEALSRSTGGPGVYKRIVHANQMLDLRYGPGDAGCTVQVTWKPADGLELPFPYGCMTEACQASRAKP